MDVSMWEVTTYNSFYLNKGLAPSNPLVLLMVGYTVLSLWLISRPVGS